MPSRLIPRLRYFHAGSPGSASFFDIRCVGLPTFDHLVNPGKKANIPPKVLDRFELFGCRPNIVETTEEL